MKDIDIDEQLRREAAGFILEADDQLWAGIEKELDKEDAREHRFKIWLVTVISSILFIGSISAYIFYQPGNRAEVNGYNHSETGQPAEPATNKLALAPSGIPVMDSTRNSVADASSIMAGTINHKITSSASSDEIQPVTARTIIGSNAINGLPARQLIATSTIPQLHSIRNSKFEIRNNRSLSIEFYSQPFYNNSRTSPKASNESRAYSKLRTSLDRPAFSYAIGVNVKVSLSPEVSVSAGLAYLSLRKRTVFNPDMDTNKLPPGYINVRGYMAPDGMDDYISQTSYLRIPVALQYYIKPGRRFTTYFSAGIDLNILLQARVLDYSIIQNAQYEKLILFKLSDGAYLAPVMANITAAAGGSYAITHKLSVFGDLSYGRGVGPVFKDTYPVKGYVELIGARTGLRFSLR